MSLLINESYASPSKSIWLGSSGGVVDGSLQVAGGVRAGTSGAGDVQTSSAFTMYNPSTITTRGRITADDTQTLFLQANNSIKFGQVSTGTVNTSLAISPPGTNADVLTVGGSIVGIGPIPTSATLDAYTKAVAIGAPADFTVSCPLFPLVDGAEYDVQCNGYWTTGATITTALEDYAEVSLAVGAGTSPGYFNFTATYDEFPNSTEDPWKTKSFRPFKIRARMVSNGIPAMILQAAIYSPSAGGSYPGLTMTITMLDIVRVK